MVDWNSSESSAIALNCFKSHLEHKGKWWASIFFLIFFRRLQGNLPILVYWPKFLCSFACCSFCCALPSFSASKSESSGFLFPEVALVWVVWKCLCTSCRVVFSLLVKNDRAGETQGLLARPELVGHTKWEDHWFIANSWHYHCVSCLASLTGARVFCLLTCLLPKLECTGSLHMLLSI